MLVLSRHRGESIIIGDDGIVITVVEIRVKKRRYAYVGSISSSG